MYICKCYDVFIFRKKMAENFQPESNSFSEIVMLPFVSVEPFRLKLFI